MDGLTFELTVLGGTGGPFDINTQCFMIRPFGKGTKNFICIDGGSGLSQIAHILQLQEQSKHRDGDSALDNDSDDLDKSTSGQESEQYDDPFCKYYSSSKDTYLKTYGRENESDEDSLVKLTKTRLIDISKDRLRVQLGFSNDILSHFPRGNNIIQNSYMIFQGIKEYYITHPHMDHVAGMVINSPLAFEDINTIKAKNHKECKDYNKFNIHKGKILYGLPFVTDALQKHIFNDTIWPHLINTTNSNLRMVTLDEFEITNSKCFPELEILPFKICHGCEVSNDKTRLFSTVYLIRDVLSGSTILIFGDTDYNQNFHDGKSSSNPTSNLLSEVWDYLAKNIESTKLKGIFIECSNSQEVEDAKLYGHLSSRHLINELNLLNTKYLQYQDQMIDVLNIFITHVKMIPSDIDPRKIIINELREFAKDEPLLKNFKFSIALNNHSFIL